MPKFVVQRSLYEVRERPSKAYSWAAFLISNVIVEIPYQVFIGIIAWACYYYPVYGAEQASQRQGLMLLLVVQFYIFTSTFAALVIAALPDAETGGTIATLMFIMTVTFNGVLQPPNALPGKNSDKVKTFIINQLTRFQYRILDLHVQSLPTDLLDRGYHSDRFAW
jgi:ABC-type multidrug transport system permease subunit